MPDQTQQFSFKVLTINIHKGFTAFNRRFILPELRDAVRTVSADIVCLQEVMGAHEVHPLHVENWPDTSHYEFLADTMWSDFAYGRNAVYPEGHHGNAVLSRYPIEHYENRDVSVDGAEKRGVLYCRIVPPMTGKAIHVMCVHLGLREAHRQAQLAMLAEWVNELPDWMRFLPAPTDARRARFRCNFLYYDWTGSTSKMPAPARQPRCRCGHGDTFLIMPL